MSDDVRTEKVDRVRQELEEGRYVTREKLEETARRILEELRG